MDDFLARASRAAGRFALGRARLDFVERAVLDASRVRLEAAAEACRIILQSPSMPYGLRIDQGWVDKGTEGMRFECEISWDEDVAPHSWRERAFGDGYTESCPPKHYTAAHVAAGAFRRTVEDCPRCQVETQLGFEAPLRLDF